MRLVHVQPSCNKWVPKCGVPPWRLPRSYSRCPRGSPGRANAHCPLPAQALAQSMLPPPTWPLQRYYHAPGTRRPSLLRCQAPAIPSQLLASNSPNVLGAQQPQQKGRPLHRWQRGCGIAPCREAQKGRKRFEGAILRRNAAEGARAAHCFRAWPGGA